jgi:aminoglycoside phosphotransferase (APT) family kinase protein
MVDLNTLAAWAAAHYGAAASVEGVRPMPGNAGISFGFDVVVREAGTERREPLVIRVPPAGVRRQGNTDVLRQVPVLQSARAEGVPVAEVKWWSSDERWFGVPFFMVERLTGRSVNCWNHAETSSLDIQTARPLFQQAVEALAAIHAVRWSRTLDGWAVPRSLATEVEAWTPTLAKAEDPSWIAAGTGLRDELFAQIPDEPEPGLVHGDFYSNNWVFDGGTLQGVVDWELATIGPPMLDLGWLCMMYDPDSWGPTRQDHMGWCPPPLQLAEMYEAAADQHVRHLNWYRALAAWRLSSITALNVRLHRSGRRPDPLWELIAEAVPYMVAQGRRLLA